MKNLYDNNYVKCQENLKDITNNKKKKSKNTTETDSKIKNTSETDKQKHQCIETI